MKDKLSDIEEKNKSAIHAGLGVPELVSDGFFLSGTVMIVAISEGVTAIA